MVGDCEMANRQLMFEAALVSCSTVSNAACSDWWRDCWSMLCGTALQAAAS